MKRTVGLPTHDGKDCLESVTQLSMLKSGYAALDRLAAKWTLANNAVVSSSEVQSVKPVFDVANQKFECTPCFRDACLERNKNGHGSSYRSNAIPNRFAKDRNVYLQTLNESKHRL